MLNRPTTILVPLDGSPLAEGVLAYLHPLATPEMTELALVQVIEIWRYAFGADAYSMPYLITAAQSSAEEYLAQQRERLERLGYRVTTHVATGEAAHSILDLAQTTLADFIAMSTHGRSGFVGWALGSVAERVLQEATVPVFLVRANMPAQQPLQHILVPLDGSTLAEQALPKAQALAQRTGATVTLLQAIQSLGEEQGEIVF
ncbi:MAG: universal stress protein, partial [Chloroflexota bacterium]|nr:universal stress protein [Chloroflexota bacterium]